MTVPSRFLYQLPVAMLMLFLSSITLVWISRPAPEPLELARAHATEAMSTIPAE